MGINFPNTPAVGELHPTPPQAGVPQYRWDGVAWVAQSQDQLAFVKRTGDTMSGALTLPADPAAALQAATKQYVDAKSSLYISDNPPSSPPDGSMWWDSDNGLLYIRYNDGAGPSQWVQAVATPAIDASVFVNKAGDTMGGALTLPGDPAAALQAAPKQYVDAVRAYAAPYDANAVSGMQINGAMEVNQELGTGTAGTSGNHLADGWKLIKQGTSVVSGGATPFVQFSRFPSYLYIGVTTAQPTMAAGDFVTISQNIEGWRIARLHWGTANARPLTIGFWTKHIRTGVYSLVVRSPSAGNRSYATTYTQAVSDIEQYNIVTIPGCTDGTWKSDNTIGLVVELAMACGATFTAPSANGWIAGTYSAAPGQINGVAATSDIFRITGVVVLPGTQAPTAAQSPTIMRPYDQELVTCQRYYWKSSVIVDTTPAMQTTTFLTPMRTTPTITGGAAGFTVQTVDFNCVSMSQTARNYQLLSFDARL